MEIRGRNLCIILSATSVQVSDNLPDRQFALCMRSAVHSRRVVHIRSLIKVRLTPRSIRLEAPKCGASSGMMEIRTSLLKQLSY